MLVFEEVELWEGLIDFVLLDLFLQVNFLLLDSSEFVLEERYLRFQFLVELGDRGENLLVLIGLNRGNVFFQHWYGLSQGLHLDLVLVAAQSQLLDDPSRVLALYYFH